MNLPEPTFGPVNSMGNYKYVIILAMEQGKLLWCRQKKKTTWELPGGHIEPGETPFEAAKRELFEETGAEEFSIRPIFDYKVEVPGVVFLAEITRRGGIPQSEMEEVRPSVEIPGEWSWPQIQPKILGHYRELFEGAPLCTFASVNSMGHYRFAVVLAKEGGKFLWCRQKGKTTWEIPGGHIEPGETPEQAAQRELFEETGAEEFAIRPIFDYWAKDEKGESTGVVFLAEITRRGSIPPSEMEEIRAADEIPGEWSWPQIHPKILGHYRELVEEAHD